VIQLPGLPPKGESVWDWIEAGGTLDQLKQIVGKDSGCEGATPDMPRPDAPPAQPNTEIERGIAARGIARRGILVPPPNATNLLTQLLNDTGNADRLITFRGNELRYCPAIRKWLVLGRAALGRR